MIDIVAFPSVQIFAYLYLFFFWGVGGWGGGSSDFDGYFTPGQIVSLPGMGEVANF